MTREHAERTIRAFLDVSLNRTDYPLTVQPEPGKTGDWRFCVFYADDWSYLKPSGHITWNGTTWRIRAAGDKFDKSKSTSTRPTEAELRSIVNDFLRKMCMTGSPFTLHDVTDGAARFTGLPDDITGLPEWSGQVTWTTTGRCSAVLLIDSKVEFDKPADPAKPVPDLGPFYAAKVKAEAEAEHAEATATTRLAELERAHRTNMDDIDAALKQIKAPAQPSTSPLSRLKDTIAEHEAWSMRRGSTDTVPPDWPTLRQSQDAILDAAHELCAAWKRR